MSGAAGFTARLWHEPLTELGFRAAGNAGLYHRDDLVFAVESDWGYLRSEWRDATAVPWQGNAFQGDPLHGVALQENPRQDPLTAPGLWKTVGDPASADVRAVWELPPTILAEIDPRSHGAEGLALFADTLAWALATASGAAPPDWTSPDTAFVAEFASSEALSLRAGHLLRQGSLVREPGRLALRFRVLDPPPAPPPKSRAVWLAELLRDAQRRWRLVRLHTRFAAREPGAVDAVVDLTGVPAPLAEPFLQSGSEALRCAVEHLIREVDFLASSTVSRALEVLSPRATPAQPVR